MKTVLVQGNSLAPEHHHRRQLYGGFTMKLLSLRNSIALALLSVAVSVSANPLVVCTEASPEGFDMVQYTTAVTADAVAETVFNRLADFKPEPPRVS
ncbi:Dipeptide ABC transporter, periplasmic dipeptide-binding protein, partial [Pseudomonas savastanoi pv. glycinea]